MHDSSVIRSYDPVTYDFAGAVRHLLGIAELSRVHTVHPPQPDAATDQNTAAHKLFYDGFYEIRPLYRRFLRREIQPLFGTDLAVQTIPTFRVSAPGGTAVQEFHRDSDYHHQRGTVNFWLPLTKAFGTNTIWIESAPDTGDYRPVDLAPGEYLQFDAINLRHGNVRNETDASRVSFDFRVIPLRQFVSTGLRTVSSTTRLEIGDYYMELRLDA
jgi:hypothetical protein